jgi:hypothetical protein
MEIIIESLHDREAELQKIPKRIVQMKFVQRLCGCRWPQLRNGISAKEQDFWVNALPTT